MKLGQDGDYVATAREGMGNPCLQGSLRSLQARYGKGALEAWKALPDPNLRSRVKARRMQTLAHLDRVLALLSQGVEARGGQVFFADNAEAANGYIRDLARKRGVKRVVKGKSMLSAEIGFHHLNPLCLQRRVNADLSRQH